ncbi:MAG: phosphotransferase [Anaerolineae bacterium]|nr:phosphotransferase [Anaerolineae bacterium]
MSNIPLKDILITARQESHRMRHFFLGVEHLFIALLEIKSGLASSILADEGFAPEYVIDAIRRKAGKGSRHRLWAGIPNSPRTEVVLGIAHEIAGEQQRQNLVERDILIAILEENDSIPVRVLRALGVNLDTFRSQARVRRIVRAATGTFVRIDFSPGFEGDLDKDQLFILRRMFHGYTEVRIETRLTGGYTRSTLLVVTPIRVDNRADAPVVVKIGPGDMILDEAQRYERYVKNTLPPLTARLEDRPTAPETSDLAGIKYTFVTDPDGNPADMRVATRKWSGERLGEWLQMRLYQHFGEGWWKQNRMYRFEAWQEYDWVLPPMLTLEVSREEKAPEGAHILRFPVKRHKISAIEYGDMVAVENFIVQKVDKERNTVLLALGQGSNSTTRACEIEIHGIDFERDAYYRGEVVESIVGRVWKSRSEQLTAAVQALNPDFDFHERLIPVQQMKLPNPLFHYAALLEETVEGTLCTIHGDLHPGNILVGPGESALLIDFGRTREGHTLFDWATLEISLLADYVLPVFGDDWNAARRVIEALVALNRSETRINATPDTGDALRAIVALREIVDECLAVFGNRAEYYMALAFCSLRAVTWETLSLPGRRLMFLVAALATHEYLHRQPPEASSGRTSTPDATDFMSRSNENS